MKRLMKKSTINVGDSVTIEELGIDTSDGYDFIDYENRRNAFMYINGEIYENVTHGEIIADWLENNTNMIKEDESAYYEAIDNAYERENIGEIEEAVFGHIIQIEGVNSYIIELGSIQGAVNVDEVINKIKEQFGTAMVFTTNQSMGGRSEGFRYDRVAKKERLNLKRLIKRAEQRTFYHGSALPRALEILNGGSINAINTQGEGAASAQNVSLQNNAVYVTTSKDSAATYAKNFKRAEYGVIFEMTLDTTNMVIDEDTFAWGEGLGSEENRDTFNKMFGGDKEKASEFIENLVADGFFEGKTGYDPYDDEEFEIKQEDYVGLDDDMLYHMDLSGLQFANVDMANEIIRMIPFEDQLEANNNTFAYVGDIALSSVTNYYLVGGSEEFTFTSPQEVIDKYNELTQQGD